MKRILYLIMMCCFVLVIDYKVNAQTKEQSSIDTVITNDDDFLKGFEVSNVDNTPAKKYYKVLAIAYTGNFVMHKLDDFNLFTNTKFNMPELKTPIYLSGFNANFSVEQTKNFNIGFSYSAGSKNIDSHIDVPTDYTRNVNYRVSYTSIDLNYAIVPFESFSIMPGVSFGLSNLKLQIYQSKSKYDYNNDLGVNKDSNSFNNVLDGNFYFAEPHIYIQYKLSQNFSFKAGAGYSFAFSPTWKFNSDGELSNMPSNIKPEGLNILFGIYFGFFDF